MKQHKGFTLIELMIVVAIVGIIAAIVADIAKPKEQAGIEHTSEGVIIINTQEAE